MLIKMSLRKLSDLKKPALEGKRALVRVDFNVPLEEGRIVNDDRIKKALPTIKYLLDNGAAVVICTHLGRPAGRATPEFSVAPIAAHLAKLLGQAVQTASDCTGEAVQKAKQMLKPGEILMLENTRFHTAETENEHAFAKDLATGCDLFVSDAFGTVHRAHASTVGVAHFLPAYAGLLVEREVEILAKALKSAERPFVLVAGGAKIDTKIGVIRHFLKKADAILVGGGLANTFLYAAGYEVGKSLCEKDKKNLAESILTESAEFGDKLKLPMDATVASEISPTAQTLNKKNVEITAEDMILDIGLETEKNFIEHLKSAKMIVWNGPLGLSEHEIFAHGTRRIAEAIAGSQALTVIGGGDTIEAIERFGISEDRFTHVSTGGGAMIEFLEGKILPGLAILKEAKTF